ncbi:MAG: DUF1566 domain-containing protein [Gammaproteobacteria bacterium]
MSAQARFTKISATGKPLAAAAKTWPVVSDQKTDRMWATKPIAVADWKPATIKKIEAQLRESKLGGFDDWRIPTVEELFVLADRTRTNPAIDEKFFPKCPSDWFWSSSPYAPSPGDCAWFVSFYSGLAYCYNRLSYGFVRAVRGGQ